MEEIKQLRQLARQYYTAAMSTVNVQRMQLHKAVNDLRMERPVVLISEIPFHELNFDGSLTNVCSDPILQEAETFLRRNLFQWKYFPADMILTPFLPVKKIIRDSDIGIKVAEERLYSNEQKLGIAAQQYQDQLADETSVEKIHLPIITYDEAATLAKFDRLQQVLGDIIPIRMIGHTCYATPWDRIARYRGADNLLIDLIDRPEHTHNIVRKIYECEKSRWQQMEEQGLLELEPYNLHCTAALSDELAAKYDGGKIKRQHVWGRGMAQILSTVGSAMHEEFEIDYMKDLMADFGMNYYGCCEPLDQKMDIVEKLPNLRKVSITPWADVDVAAEAIGKKYVLANKPNPSLVATTLNEEALTREIDKTLAAVKRNQCSCDIVLKDISTVGGNIQNLIRWEQIVMERVRNF